MSVEDFLNKCTPDSKDRFIIYLIFMNNIVSNKKLKEGFEVFSKSKNEYLTNGMDIGIFYLLYVLYYTNADVGVMFHEHNANIEEYFEVGPNAKNELDRICENFKGVSISALKTCFEEEDWGKLILTRYTGINREYICAERVLINASVLITNISGLNEAFKVNDCLEKIKALAVAKEGKFQIPKIYVEDLSEEKKEQAEQLFSMFQRNAEKREKKPLEEAQKKEESVILEKDLGCGEELTSQKYEYNPLVGREKELRKLGALLLDDEKSVILYGEPGVGKTTLVKGLAYQIQQGIAHESLREKKIYEVSAAELLSGTKYRGDFEKKLLEIVNKLLKSKKSILFIDEIHTLMGLGTTTEYDNLDASNILKPYLGDGRIKLIGGTTTDEYKIIEKNRAFDRRFIGLEVPELSKEELIELLKSFIIRYKDRKGIGFSYPEEIQAEILNLMIALSRKEYQNLSKKLYNPDLSLTLLRLGYDFARYDHKESLDADALIEGIQFSKHINENGKEYFQEQVLKLTK